MPFHPTLQPVGYPTVNPYPVYTGGTAFNAGELVFYDTTNNGVDRCGADPALILGIAMCGSADASIYPNSRIPVAVIHPESVVTMSIAGGTNPSDTIVGDSYGIVRTVVGSTGFWEIDLTEGVATRVFVTEYRPARLTSGAAALQPGQNLTYVRFLAANLQGDAIAS
jgi:hypothetical protein